MSVVYPPAGGDAGLSSNQPGHIAVGPGGKLYISDSARVWRIDAGRLVATAGTGLSGFSGDGGPATVAQLASVEGLAADAAGNLYVADGPNFRLRRVDPGGTISTVAGNGSRFFAGDGGPATSAMFAGLVDLAVDAAHNLYVEDSANNRVRKVDTSGIVTTVAGNGVAGFSGDGGPAPAASLNSPAGLAVDADGNLLIADAGNYRVRKVDHDGIISTVAGTGGQGFSGDGGPATAAELGPLDVAVGPGGNLWVLDTQNHRLRLINRSGIITTVAGNGATDGSLGTSGRALGASLAGPTSVAVDAVGNAYVADLTANRVFKVDPGGGIRSAVDEHLSLGYPFGLALDATGRLYIAEALSNVVRRLEPTGSLTMVAGTGAAGYSGDGGRAVDARLWAPTGLVVDGTDLYVADNGNARVREVTDVAQGVLARAWGWNHVGQSGNAPPWVTTTQPTTVTGLGSVRSVAAGYYHSLAVKPDGTVWAWGWNAFGQLGNGTTADAAVPVQVSGLTGVVAVAGGSYHSLALKADGSVWAWGWNHYGQLGTGSTLDSPVPVQVPGLTGVTSIAAGALHNLVVKGDGTVWGWGLNQLGQLGPGLPSAPSPVTVPGVAAARSVAAGGFHSLAVLADSTVWSWGWNVYGQTGQASAANVRTPAPVPGVSMVRSVAAGALHSLALDMGGRVWAWGWNGVGQIGDLTTLDARAPVELPAPLQATSLAAGAYHSVAVAGDGQVWTWGWNHFGQLGTGTEESRPFAYPVPGRTDGNVAAGVGHTLG
jgi:sugar lactone lactonase YvrE